MAGDPYRPARGGFARVAQGQDLAGLRVDTINNPKTYAFQVAYSVILQQLRHSRVVPIAAVAYIAALETAGDEPSLEDAAIARDELRRVEMAIDALPRQTRTAFILRRVEGLSQQAIAGRRPARFRRRRSGAV